ncbi:cupin domain-containing protein [Cupriavidus sp. D384]|uniref:(R)-mandelonitrile lyase n=1 Tax=Cupriavidus sp. D384 TaxID=1538095 RepID=UPI00082EB3C5|nr:cupin domain-containing protein [Cupriavidus sp. D384]
MIKVTRPCQQASSDGPAAYFSGSVRIDSHFQAEGPARVGGATVTFAPGARTAWHTHPLGQTLMVVAGVGIVQQWGEPPQTIRPGDLVWIPPHTKHWHGATDAISMAHIAIAETMDGTAVAWMEQVSAEEYDKAQQRRAA